eukprot:TRINITY_DN3701_c0_g1_i1.p1 TRINITY_DN3701_c0_g1~~TRINITY_DN3701_c0_g1_i1.p1  ORF type:complete len:403 (-),score=179.64 TRINITY_DN3701_c0_g1_i1:179-1387(-)
MVLTNKQREELNKAIVDYLISSNYTEAATALQREGNVIIDPKVSGLLEKKWTSIIRLQKKISELEAQNQQLEDELNSGGRRKKVGTGDTLPRAPASLTLVGHRGNVTCVAFHPIFSQIASGSEDGLIKIWDYESGELERTLRGHTNAVQDITYDHAGTILASCAADLTIKFWNTQTWDCMKTLRGHDHNISSITFTPAADHLISCSRDKAIKIWETSTGYCIRTIEGHGEWVRKVVITDEGNLIASCSTDQTIRIWEFSTGRNIAILREHTHVVETIAFSPPTLTSLNDTRQTTLQISGVYLASGSRDKTIKIWEVATGQCIMTLEGHDNWVRGLIFHPSGKYLISVSDDKTIRIWDIKQQRCTKVIADAHNHFISSLAFNVKDPIFATTSVDQSLKIWPCK